MKTRIIQTKFWSDPFIRKLKPYEKLVYLYLITNEKVNIIHCFEIDRDEIAFTLGVTRKQIDETILILVKEKKIAVYKNWVFLVNADKYENYVGNRNEIAKEKLLKEMSDDVKDWYNNPLDRGIYRGIDRGIKGVYIPSINNKSEIINNNRGIIKGGNFSSIKDITPSVIEEIAKKYKVSVGFVSLQFEKLKNYCEAKGRKYKNYKSALRNFVLGDLQRQAERKKNDQFRSVDATNL